MKDLILKNKLLFVLLALYFSFGIWIFFTFDEKGQVERIINRHHDPYLDIFFFYITYLGDGWGSVIIIFLAFLRRIYYGILTLLALLSSSVVVQAMKRLIFHDSPRPSKFFEKEIDLHIIDGLDLHSYFSFPSGHSSGAFSVFIMLALISKNKMMSVLYLVLSAAVAFSRVYLLQHFYIDTWFGAAIGVLAATLVYYYVEYRSNLPQNSMIQRPLLKLSR